MLKLRHDPDSAEVQVTSSIVVGLPLPVQPEYYVVTVTASS